MILLILLLSAVLYCSTIFSCLKFQESNFFKLIISIILSLSLLGILFSVNLFLNISYVSYIVELLCLDVMSLFLLRKTRFEILKLKIDIDKSLIFFSFIFLIGTILFWDKANRWGGWDAWAIWNLHAKFLFSEECWTNLFTHKISWTHPDYPLMLPSLIAVFWKGIGNQNPIVPAIIAYFTFLSILCLIYTSINNTRFKAIGLLGVMFFIIDFRFMSQTSSQYADTLVALFILIAIILLSKRDGKSHTFFLLVGFFSSLPIWVKNEGNVFFIFTSILIVYQNKKDIRKILCYLIGALPIVFIYAYFKIFYAPDNDIIGTLNTTTFEKILSIERYIIVAKYLINTLIFQFPVLLILFFAVLILYPKVLFSWMTFIILSTLASYLFVYIVTPHDINWHLNTSLNRLIHQVYPSCIYCSLLIINKYYLRPTFCISNGRK